MTDKDGKNKHLPDHFCKPTVEDCSRAKDAHAQISHQISDFPQNQLNSDRFAKLKKNHTRP